MFTAEHMRDFAVARGRCCSSWSSRIRVATLTLTLALVRPADHSIGVRAHALFDFTAEEADELSLVRGEEVLLLPSSPEEDWVLARAVDGQVGLVPRSYVSSTAPESSVTAEVTAAGAVNWALDATEPASASAADEHGAASSAALLVERCADDEPSWECVQHAWRSHHGLRTDAATGPAAFASELRLVLSAAPPPAAFSQSLLLPPQPAPPPPAGWCKAARCGHLVSLAPALPRYEYPPPYEEQFNAQRSSRRDSNHALSWSLERPRKRQRRLAPRRSFALMELMYMARQSNRLLVEPRMHLMPRNDSEVERGQPRDSTRMPVLLLLLLALLLSRTCDRPSRAQVATAPARSWGTGTSPRPASST